MPNSIRVPKKITRDQLPVKIGTDVSVESYNKYFTKSHSQYKIERRDNGDVFVVEMADFVREVIVGAIKEYFFSANLRPSHHNNPIKALGQPFHLDPTGNGAKIAADVTILPNITFVQPPVVPYPGPPPGGFKGFPHGRIVCEVATSQSTGNFQARCIKWLRQPYVRYVIGIKLCMPRASLIGGVGTPHHQKMTATVWRQNEAPSTLLPAAGAAPAPAAAPAVLPVAGAAGNYQFDRWDFGTLRKSSNAPTGCNAAGNPAFTMRFPTNQIFWDPPIPPVPGYVAVAPPGIAATVDIDLYEIQQAILNCQD